MTATIINGRAIAKQQRKALKDDVASLQQRGITPRLDVILVGEDSASQVYVRNKQKTANRIGIESHTHLLEASTPPNTLIDLIQSLNNDASVHGILLQLPLPTTFPTQNIVDTISYAKDVDGITSTSLGRLLNGRQGFHPCTPQAVMELLKQSNIPLQGKHAVIVGRSTLVGKPLAQLLLQKNATVTICHSKTNGLSAHCRLADILISAVGKQGLISKDMVKPQATVIDVGINTTANGELVGDVKFDEAAEIAAHITPVPRGVGPMTVTMLMANVIQAAKNQV